MSLEGIYHIERQDFLKLMFFKCDFAKLTFDILKFGNLSVLRQWDRSNYQVNSTLMFNLKR
jgi:hypothetical protein